MLSFHALETRFGLAAAYHFLTEIEKAACIRSSDMAHIDPELRLAHACSIQDLLAASAQAA